MKIEVGPTGKLVRGSIFDVGKEGLERALKAYDAQLYLAWNPRKNRGMGCWEVRRRPDEKTAVLVTEYRGGKYYDIKYQELDIVNHVLDVPALNYDVLNKIKAMDTWGKGDFGRELEYKEYKHREKVISKNAEDLRYTAKQMRREIRDLKEAILSGLDPSLIVKNWK